VSEGGHQPGRLALGPFGGRNEHRPLDWRGDDGVQICLDVRARAVHSTVGGGR